MNPHNINIDYWREQNVQYNSEWLFPVRVEAKDRIQWYPNLTEAFAVMKKPLDRVAWENLLRQKRICAYDDADNTKLAAWWDIGWQQTPQLEPKQSAHGNPILHIGVTPLGETLDLIYPNITTACANIGYSYGTLYRLCAGLRTSAKITGRLHSMRKINAMRLENAIAAAEHKPWTLFAPDNTILGHFRTREELAAATPYSWQQVNRAHLNNYNELPNGTWVWYERWDIMPISPQDEPLGLNWRTKYAPKTTVQSEID